MKKTTKKLISIFLSLLMVLSLIPMGTMTAMAYNDNDHCQCGHPFVNHPQGFPTMCVRCPDGNCTSGGFTPESETCDKCLTCGHDASVHEDGGCNDCGIRDACFEYGSANREFCALSTGHTGNHNSYLPKTYDGAKGLYINYTNSYGWRANDPRLAKYMSLNLSDTLINVPNNCYSNGTVYCDGVQAAYQAKLSGTVVKMDSDVLYICSDHTGDLGTLCETCTVDTTPEWFDTIVAKVDASADKLVNEKGETYAEISAKDGGITGAIAQLTNPVYTNEGSVYTIRGYLGASIVNEGELVITLDSNGDVASLAVNAYVTGNQVNSTIYAPHTCTLAKKNGQSATCTKDGWKAYYQCKDKNCGKIYATNNASGTAYDTLTAWKASKAGKIAKTGHSYTSAVTKKATYSAEGVRTYTCSKCGNKYTKAIAKLKLTTDAKYSNSTKMNAGFKVSSSTKNVTVNWGKVAGADGYMIYANYCGKDTKPVLIKTIKGEDVKSYTFSKMNGKNIDLTKNLKVYVVAYSTIDGKKVQVSKSITGHVIGGKNKKYTNPTKVTVKNDKVTLSVGKTSTIKATVTYKNPAKKHVSDAHAPEKRYRSSNNAVATVDANGKITAVGKGTCIVYVFAKNGTSAKVTVTVK